MVIDDTEYYSEISRIQKKYPYCSLSSNVKEAFEKDLRVRLSWNTNSLEGNTLTLEETVNVIDYDEVRSGHTYQEYTEAKNAFRASSRILDFSGREDIDEEFLHKTCAVILGSDGAWRSRQVYVGTLAEAAYLPPAPEKVPSAMEAYISRLQKFPETKTDPEQSIRQAGKLHMEFEMIHPFPDGNGRTGRLVMDQLLVDKGLLPAIIKDRAKYRQAFRMYERNRSTSLMEHCIVSGITESYRILEDICRKLEPENSQ